MQHPAKIADSEIMQDSLDKELAEFIKAESNKSLIMPLKVLAYLTAISGLFALIFEVKYFAASSVDIYAFRFFAIAAAFWVLILADYDFGKRNAVYLVHFLMISIIISFGAVIIILPSTLVVNSQIAALVIFTSSIFFSWEVKNQIITAIYYNIIFASSILLNNNSIYHLPNFLQSFIFVTFLSCLSIAAGSLNYKLRKNAIIKAFEVAHSENKYRNLFENNPVGMFRLDKENRIVMINNAFMNILGYENKDELINANFLEQFYDFREDGFSIINKVKSSNHNNHSISVLKKKDGQNIIGDVSFYLNKDSATSTEYLEGILYDISTQVAAEEALIDAKEKAERSERLKTEFLAQMSHEIRTPINAILSATEFIKDELLDRDDDDVDINFRIIDSASKRIIRTIDLILNTSQLQTGNYDYHPRKFDLFSDCLLPLHNEFYFSATEKKLNFGLRKETDRSTVLADEYSINQIFKNVIDNAIKYTALGFIEIVLFRNEEDKLSVAIKDSGIGISKEYIPQLFDPFSQEFKGYSRQFEGNGLGMALVKSYCELNKASIQIDSEKGSGTTVLIVFNNS